RGTRKNFDTCGPLNVAQADENARLNRKRAWRVSDFTEGSGLNPGARRLPLKSGNRHAIATADRNTLHCDPDDARPGRGIVLLRGTRGVSAAEEDRGHAAAEARRDAGAARGAEDDSPTVETR